jgi:phage portal protein BeeE
MNKVQKWIASRLLGIKASPPPAGAMQPFGVGQFTEIGGQITWIADKLSSYVSEGYSNNDIVYSAVMLVMDKIRCAPWNLYRVVDESSLKRYQGIISSKFDTKDWHEAMRLRKKALEPMTSFNNRLGKLNDLLKWPNEDGTWSDLIADGAGFKMITGNEMMWANLLDAGANKGVPQELMNAPAQWMSPFATRGFPQRIVGWQLNNGFIKQFKREEILHLKFWNPDYDANGSGLMGMSPLKPGSKTLKRNNSAKKAGAVQLDNNGTPGIAYIDDPLVPSTGRESQIAATRRAWANEHTGAEMFNKVALSGYKFGYVSVGSTLKEMDLSGIEALDLRRIFNLWGIPSQLGNDPDNKTYNSLKEAEKALTTRGALPHLTAKRDHFNRKLQTDWGFKGVNVYADFDMSVYTELQEDQKEKWEWVSKLPVSSAYKLELMGLDVPDDPNMQVILVDGSLVPLADVVNNLSDDDMQRINEDLSKAGLNDYLRVAK